MKMFKFLTLILAFSTFQANAENTDCMQQLENLMVSSSEKLLFKTQKPVFEYFQLNCEPDGMGVNNIFNHGSVVFVHEAAHFADLGIDHGNEAHDLNLSKFDLLTVSNERIGAAEKYKALPMPMDIIGSYLKKNRPELLKEDSPYMSMHDGYLLDPSTLAAQNVLGLATELNGYTHGATMELRNKTYLPDDVQYKDPESGLVFKLPYSLKKNVYQLDGLFYFLFNTNLYFNLIKDSNETIWNHFFTEKNRTFLNKLFAEALIVLKSTNICERASISLSVGFYVNEFRNLDRTILNEILGEENVKPLLCEGYGILTEDASNSSLEDSEIVDTLRFESIEEVADQTANSTNGQSSSSTTRE